jgi:adenylate cyclase
MELRIGINLGDVITDEDRLYGDGVNIAARMEALAEAGGICISGTAYDQVENKLPLAYDALGEQQVKNIARPVRVYRVRPLGETTAPRPAPAASQPQRRRFTLMLAVVAGLVLLTGGVVLWHRYARSPLPFDPAAARQTARELAGKPSIAVLPFTNLSADPEQEYFSDGITNDIITDLAKFRELVVIASNTVFTYKGKPVTIEEVAQELGVRYVLEGSVQKLGEQVRVNAQLIDAATGHYLWAERYERELKDLFAVQDEIMQTLVTTLALKISAVEQQRALQQDTESLEAYDYVLRGLEYLRSRTRSDTSKAQDMFQRAMALDPQYATAYVDLGSAYYLTVAFGWTAFPAQALEQALTLGGKALHLDNANAHAHSLLGIVYLTRGQHDLALNELQQAIALNPNDARSYATLGWIMLWSGQTEAAVDLLKTALRFDPSAPDMRATFMNLGLAYYLKEQYADAIHILARGRTLAPDFVGFHIALAATYAQSGRREDAAQAAQTVLRLQPFFTLDAYGRAFRNSADRARIIDGLRKAGLR